MASCIGRKRRLRPQLEVIPGRSFSLLFGYVQIGVGLATNPLGWYPKGIPKLKTCSSGTEYGGGTDDAGDPSGEA